MAFPDSNSNPNSNPNQDTGTGTRPGPGSGGGSAGQKRPACENSNNNNNNNNNDRASKRRAAKACLSCRNRKVRCDVVTGGHPCTNCRLDELECVVAESNRGRKPAATSTSTTSTQAPPHNASLNPSSSQVRLSSILDTPSPGLQQASRPSDCIAPLSFGDQQRRGSFQEEADQIPVNDPPQNHRHEHQNNSPSPRDDDPNRPSIQSPGPAYLRTAPKPDGSIPHLPPYIRPLPRHICTRDLSYLADKGALDIPDDAFRDELLRAYVNFVYPFMPAIDLEDFLVPIMRADGRDPVSLVLFQAVMFASVTFIDPKLLQSRGFSSRKAARKDFFGRVRLLYGLDCEQDHLPLIQAVLLMTYWYGCPDDGKDTWHWMGIALSLAQLVGLHRETELCRTTIKKKRLRRRIWWSCVMQDRLLALGIRRPSRIRDEEFNVPQLTLDDFDLSAPSDTITSLLGESRFTVPNPSARSEMAVMCIELSRLCVCLGRILHSQYSVVSDQPLISEYLLRIVVVPKRSRSSQQDLITCDAELNEWLNSQDPHSQYTPGSQEAGNENDKAGQIIWLHQALLHMIYLTSVSVLHKPQVLYAESDKMNSGVQKKVSREKVTKAAVTITKLGFDLQMSNQLQYMSTISVSAFLSATLILLPDIRSHDEEVRNTSIGRFYQCMSALQQLQGMYSSADYAIHFLEAVLRNVDITVPTLRPGFLSTRPDWNKPQLLRFQRSTPERGTSGQVMMAYPSPSTSRNNQVSAGVSEGNNNNCFETGIAQPSSSQNSRFEAWSGADAQFSGNQEPGEALPDPLSMGNWCDFGSLVPGLINFDGDNTFALPNSAPFSEELAFSP